jgi:uncharacterized membrane protein
MAAQDAHYTASTLIAEIAQLRRELNQSLERNGKLSTQLRDTRTAVQTFYDAYMEQIAKPAGMKFPALVEVEGLRIVLTGIPK